MNNVFNLKDPLSYAINKKGKIESVQWFRDGQYITIDLDDGSMSTLLKVSNIKKHELRQLMIMWLCLTYPDCVNFDEVEKEEKIRNSAELEN